jgi:ribosomal protein S12 methylthiotransferase
MAGVSSLEKVAIVSLGCPKNLVDSENMAGALVSAGYTLTDEEDAGAILINTCGFIEQAKREALEEIMKAVRRKQHNPALKIVVTGCLAQRYPEVLSRELPEVDAIAGVFDEARIVEALELVERGERPVFVGREAGKMVTLPRTLLRPPHQAYLKIAEGCDNRCAYCAIPMIRGHARSRDLDDLVEESAAVVELGAREIVIVAQDPTRFGLDTRGRYLLPELVSRLSGIADLKWIRLMYAHPARADVLLEAMTASGKVCRYADIPVQHSSQAVLKRMGRSGSGDMYLKALESIRARVPEVSLRSTFMVGFPGETGRDFEDLLAFIREARFEHAGVFRFCAEEGTEAESLQDRVPDELVSERYESAQRAQQEVSLLEHQRRLGSKAAAIVEGFRKGRYQCRTEFQAPDVDGIVRLDWDGPTLRAGDIVECTLDSVTNHDFAASGRAST